MHKERERKTKEKRKKEKRNALFSYALGVPFWFSQLDSLLRVALSHTVSVPLP